MAQEEAPRPGPMLLAAIGANGTFFLIVGVILVLIGALKRWDWVFWITVVELGLIAILPLITALTFLVLPPPPPPPVTAPALPTPPLAVRLVMTVTLPADAVVFVCMLVAAIRIGPWACKAVEEGNLRRAGNP